MKVTTASGAGFAGATATFAVTAGGGSLSATSVTTDAQGQASVTWTLGTAAGTNNDSATATASGLSGSPVTFIASATAGPAKTIAAVSGNNQQGLPNAPVSAPIIVRVTDQFGNPVSGQTVNFVVTLGGGSANPASAATGANGQAQTTWTLGPTLGSQTLEARVAGLTGSPVPFGVTAANVLLTAVTPDTLVEGQSATLTGAGFSATPANNTVSIGGAPAAVTAATTTSLTITVPQADCQPARDAPVAVTVGGFTSNSVTKRVHPASFLNVAIGQQVIVQDPTQFCLQFRPSTTGGDAYVVGVGASAETPSATLPFLTTSVTGASATAAAVAARPLALPAPARGGSFGMPDPEFMARRLAHWRAEARLREWERQYLFSNGAGRGQIAAQQTGGLAPAAVPIVGDTIRFRVNNVNTATACSNYNEILTKVRVVGAAGIWVTDTLNPTADSLTLAQIQAYSDTFDTKIYAVDTLYFGKPSDIDANQRVFVVLTIQVNKIDGFAGFVFAGDLFSRALCAASNQGEFFYGQVPDPNNTAGTGARTKASVLSQMPSLIAHEFTHIIQFSRRLVLSAGTDMTAWEAEGQATLAEEVVGHSVLGNMPGQNYGASVAFSASGRPWYIDEFFKLALYYGFVSKTTQTPNAPELCTLFGNYSLTTVCDPSAFYGTSWSFQRYLVDRFGPTYPGGASQLTRDWIGKNVTLSGTQNVAGLLGRNFDSLFTQWAAMLYVDDRVPGADPRLTMTSWNLLNVFSAFVSTAQLTPVARTFSSFADSRSVRGGSTAYTLLSAAGARPALALRVRDATDATLSTGMKPQLWIVRLQ